MLVVTLRPEEDPGERDERKDPCLLDEFGNSSTVEVRFFQFTCRTAAQGVQSAPDHEGPRCPVPDARDDHRDEHIEIGAQLAAAIAAEREVKVILEPGGQANVPAR